MASYELPDKINPPEAGVSGGDAPRKPLDRLFRIGIALTVGGVIALVLLGLLRTATVHAITSLHTDRLGESFVAGAMDAFKLVYRATRLCLSVLTTVGIVIAFYELMTRALGKSGALDKLNDELSKKWFELLSSKESVGEMARLGGVLIGATSLSASLLVVGGALAENAGANRQLHRELVAIQTSLSNIERQLTERPGKDPGKTEGPPAGPLSPPPLAAAGTKIEVHAQHSGYVTKVYPGLAGQTVQADTAIADLDCADLKREDQLAQAQINEAKEARSLLNDNIAIATQEVAVAKADFLRASNDAAFYKGLVDHDEISRQRYAMAVSEVEVARQKQALAEARFAAAKHRSNDQLSPLVWRRDLKSRSTKECTVRALSRGKLDQILIREGDYVSAPGNTVVAILLPVPPSGPAGTNQPPAPPHRADSRPPAAAR